MREPAQKKVLYWCDTCNVPLIGQRCGCGATGRSLPLLQPYDLRPALTADREILSGLLDDQFGKIPLPDVILLNKSGGTDRADLVIMHGRRFGWLTFSPASRKYSLDIAPEGLAFILPHAQKGILPLEEIADLGEGKVRIGGKRFPLKKDHPDGAVVVRYKGKTGSAVIRDGSIRIREIQAVLPETPRNPGWDEVIGKNRYHLKNLERNAIRTIKQHMHDRPTANVSFSGGKDSTAVLRLAQKAGVTDAFFIDTGLEFPETLDFIRKQGVEIIPKGGDFWQAVEKAGPPGKDNRWCCKLLKLNPLKLYLAKTGPCVTIQGNRWYESWNRAGLDETSQNPANPLQLNISPIRSWRAFEVYLYLWWQDIAINPLYEKGLERIGCYLCPAMLESEYELIRKTHPDITARWDAFIDRWAAEKGYPEVFYSWGLWRWKALPPKMRELCREHHIPVNADFTLRKGSPRSPSRKPSAVTTVSAGPESGFQEEMTTPEGFNPDTIRPDFPIIGDVIYLDNAATSFSPEPVISAQVEYEHRYRANIGRGVHRYTRIASQRYWHAHEKIASFIGGSEGTTVFLRNTTEAVNMVAAGLEFSPGDRILTSILEHHSNLLPWKALSRNGVQTDIVGITPEYLFDIDAFRSLMDESVRLVSVTHASNAIGVITPVREIANICREYGALLLIDGAQSVPHMPVDVREIGCDFFCFSGHKMLGPTGTGVLWMKEAILPPVLLGGGMVDVVSGDDVRFHEGYERYEAGTPSIGGGIGLGAAADYLRSIGMEKVRAHDSALSGRLITGLSGIPGVTVYATPKPEDRIGVVSFTLAGMHPHEAAQHLDDEADILVRSGHHCCQPLMEYLGLHEGTIRASLAPYSTATEVDLLVAAVEEMSRALGHS